MKLINFARLNETWESKSVPVNNFNNKSSVEWFNIIKNILLRFLPKTYRQEYDPNELLKWYSKGYFDSFPNNKAVFFKREITGQQPKYETVFSLYNVPIKAWIRDNDSEWSFDIGRAKGMRGGQVVNYLKRMLPHPNDNNLKPEFSISRPYNSADLEQKRLKDNEIKASQDKLAFDNKYIKTTLDKFEQAVSAHDWYWMMQPLKDFNKGKRSAENIKKMLAYFKDHTDEYDSAKAIYNKYKK